jgi:hypothetical protein
MRDLEAKRAYMRERYRAKKADILAYMKSRYWATRETQLVLMRKSRQEHLEDRRAYDRKRYREDPVRRAYTRAVSARSHARRLAADPEKEKARLRHQYLKATYGITSARFAEMLADQGGGCAICHRPNSERRHLSVDHDHVTGQVRGLLCDPCNRLLAEGRDSEAILRSAIDYLRKVRISA